MTKDYDVQSSELRTILTAVGAAQAAQDVAQATLERYREALRAIVCMHYGHRLEDARIKAQWGLRESREEAARRSVPASALKNYVVEYSGHKKVLVMAESPAEATQIVRNAYALGDVGTHTWLVPSD